MVWIHMRSYFLIWEFVVLKRLSIREEISFVIPLQNEPIHLKILTSKWISEFTGEISRCRRHLIWGRHQYYPGFTPWLALWEMSCTKNKIIWLQTRYIFTLQVFRSSLEAEKKHRTLFKPLVARYAKIRPYFATKKFKITANLHGCGETTYFWNKRVWIEQYLQSF